MSKVLNPFLDTVEFQNDVQTAVWDIINERQIQFITTRRQYYEEIFNVRKGLFTIKHSSLANVTDISQIELKLHNLHENSGNHWSLENFIMAIYFRSLSVTRLRRKRTIFWNYSNDRGKYYSQSWCPWNCSFKIFNDNYTLWPFYFGQIHYPKLSDRL